MEKIVINTHDGDLNCFTFSPDKAGKFPAIILYMDAYGPRKELLGMCDRLVSNGYYAILPDLYYRAGTYAPFDPKTAFSDEKERARLMQLMQTTSISKVMQDTASILSYLDGTTQADGNKIGCVGYCMGGKYALTAAATFPERVKAAASFHGGSLANDKPDSPHLVVNKIAGKIYVGVAGLDRGFTDEERIRLDDALKSAGVNYKMEIYQGAAHGFAVIGNPVYDRVASEQHWDRLLELFDDTLKEKKEESDEN